MKFCDRCGSYMEVTSAGYTCPRCGNTVRTDEIEIGRSRSSRPEGVYVVDKSRGNSLRVSRRCPRCGHHEAFRYVSVTSGEHAGVKQERAVEYYRCTKCFHSWTRS